MGQLWRVWSHPSRMLSPLGDTYPALLEQGQDSNGIPTLLGSSRLGASCAPWRLGDGQQDEHMEVPLYSHSTLGPDVLNWTGCDLCGMSAGHEAPAHSRMLPTLTGFECVSLLAALNSEGCLRNHASARRTWGLCASVSSLGITEQERPSCLFGSHSSTRFPQNQTRIPAMGKTTKKTSDFTKFVSDSTIS